MILDERASLWDGSELMEPGEWMTPFPCVIVLDEEEPMLLEESESPTTCVSTLENEEFMNSKLSAFMVCVLAVIEEVLVKPEASTALLICGFMSVKLEVRVLKDSTLLLVDTSA